MLILTCCTSLSQTNIILQHNMTLYFTQFEVKHLLGEILQQDLSSFVVPDAAHLWFDGFQRRPHLSSHRLITTIQKAAHKHIYQKSFTYNSEVKVLTFLMWDQRLWVDLLSM